MKTSKSLIYAACAALILSSVPVSAGAAETEYVYGTMDIPYADFYKAELSGSKNQYEVDAVSSATASKWSMNGEGKLVEGTFNKANEDGQGGQILGVTYPVAVTKEDLASMGSDNYSFKESSEAYDVYKVASVENGKVVFSEVKDSTPEKLTGKVTVNANTAWGDYCIDVEDKPSDMGVIYGAVIKTTDNKSYGMRHLENIWRGELAWSSGVKVTEPHGNALSYENFKDLMGATVSEVIYITNKGYYTAETSLYLPVRFEGSVTVESADVNSGETKLSTEGFPSDFNASYSFNNDLSASVKDGKVTFRNAAPGSYTVTASDKNGKYADVTGTFVLTTDSMPAAYDDMKIVKADSASVSDYADFISKISKVTVNDTEYSAAGRGAVKIIAEDGSVNMEAATRDEKKVFEGSEKYSVKVEATGYEKALEFVIDTKTAEVTTAAAQTTSAAGTTTTGKSAVKTESTPKTGDTANGLAAAMVMTLAGAAAILSFKKKNK